MSRGPLLAPHDALIRRMAAEGRSDHDIAAAVGRSANTIWQYRKRRSIAGFYGGKARRKAAPPQPSIIKAQSASVEERRERRCLRCRRGFMSEGSHNRLCSGCSATVATMALA